MKKKYYISLVITPQSGGFGLWECENKKSYGGNFYKKVTTLLQEIREDVTFYPIQCWKLFKNFGVEDIRGKVSGEPDNIYFYINMQEGDQVDITYFGISCVEVELCHEPEEYIV